MNAKELRIGNLVNLIQGFRESPIEIQHYDIDHIVNNSKHNKYEPIPLTEDWLLKFGFELKGFYRLKVTSFLELCWKPHDNTLNLQTEKNGFTENSKCKYVHQLQNLYFALTGEELSIKYL